MRYTYTPPEVPESWYSDPALLGIEPLALKILVSRGIHDAAQAAAFLFPREEELFENLSIKDLDKLIAELEDAIITHRQIVVYHDYDVDGCCACAIMLENLRRFGAITGYYCNDRNVDGFGLCRNGIDNLLAKYPDAEIVLTVDNGASAVDGINYANEKGLTVLVTDHHELGMEMPDAYALVDCKRKDETYPFHEFCGAGLALKIMIALAQKMHKDPLKVLNSLDLAALATVADVVPMEQENRTIVKYGTPIIDQGCRPIFRALNALKEVTRVSAHNTLPYLYAPMINAVSRMGRDTGRVVEALLTENMVEAEGAAVWMDRLNEERKAISQHQIELAENLVTEDQPAAIVVHHGEFEPGLIGIVAGRLQNEYHCPVIVFADEPDGILKASARSVPGINLKKILDNLAPMLVRYGGHAMAAGLSIRAEDLDAFREAFTEQVKKQPESKTQTTKIDIVVDADEVSVKTIRGLSVLEPYGAGFREPLFGLIANIDRVTYMGVDQQHVRYHDTQHDLAVIEWNGAEAAKQREKAPKKFVGKLSLNEFRGHTSVQMVVDRE